jgi:hypothetical protein
LHNILEQVDLESAGFTSNKLAQRTYKFIACLTKCILKADKVAVTISKYVVVLNEKYKTDNVILIPHGTFEIPKTPILICLKVPKVMAFGKFGTYKKLKF